MMKRLYVKTLVFFIFMLMAVKSYAFTWEVETLMTGSPVNTDYSSPDPLNSDVGSEWDASVFENGRTEILDDFGDTSLYMAFGAPLSQDAYGFYQHDTAGTEWVDGVNNSTGWTIEISMRVTHVEGVSNDCVLYILDGTYEAVVNFYGENAMDIKLKDSWITDNTQTYIIDAEIPPVYHIIRVTGEGDAINIYLENNPVPIISETLDSSQATKWLKFGDIQPQPSPYASDSYWNYIKYTTEGAFPPEPEDVEAFQPRQALVHGGYL